MRNPLLLGALFSILPTVARGEGSILWQSLPSEETNAFLSTNSALPEGFLFALGGFQPGFTATSDNVGEWLSHWTTLEIAAYEPLPYHAFHGHATLSDNATFRAGASAFLWGFDDQLDEMILLTNPDWLWPVVGKDMITLGTAWATDEKTKAMLGHYRAYPGGSSLLKTAKTADVATPTVKPEISAPRHSRVEFGGQRYQQLSFQAKAGAWKVQVSTDLRNWRTLQEIATPGVHEVRDDQPITANRSRFLRVSLR